MILLYIREKEYQYREFDSTKNSGNPRLAFFHPSLFSVPYALWKLTDEWANFMLAYTKQICIKLHILLKQFVIIICYGILILLLAKHKQGETSGKNVTVHGKTYFNAYLLHWQNR